MKRVWWLLTYIIVCGILISPLEVKASPNNIPPYVFPSNNTTNTTTNTTQDATEDVSMTSIPKSINDTINISQKDKFVYIDLQLKEGYTTIKINIDSNSLTEEEFTKIFTQARKIQKYYYATMKATLIISIIIFLYWTIIAISYIFCRTISDYRLLSFVTFGGINEDLGIKRMIVVSIFVLFILGMNFTNLYGYAIAKLLQAINNSLKV